MFGGTFLLLNVFVTHFIISVIEAINDNVMATTFLLCLKLKVN